MFMWGVKGNSAPIFWAYHHVLMITASSAEVLRLLVPAVYKCEYGGHDFGQLAVSVYPDAVFE